jgi:predicted  nucleic acid-binding Zn-ribbon protein
VAVDQTLINWLFAGFGAALGWIMKIVWDAISDLKADMKQIERDLPEVYVRKDDFRNVVSGIKEDMKDMRTDMKEGFNKIDHTLSLLFKKLEMKEDKD